MKPTARPSNVNEAESPAEIIHVDVSRDFAFFDALPPELRQLLNHAPGMFQAEELAQLLEEFNPEELRKAMELFYKKHFPGWDLSKS